MHVPSSFFCQTEVCIMSWNGHHKPSWQVGTHMSKLYKQKTIDEVISGTRIGRFDAIFRQYSII